MSDVRSKTWIAQDKALFQEALQIFIDQYPKAKKLLREQLETEGPSAIIFFDEGVCGFKGTKRLHEIEILVHKSYEEERELQSKKLLRFSSL